MILEKKKEIKEYMHDMMTYSLFCTRKGIMQICKIKDAAHSDGFQL